VWGYRLYGGRVEDATLGRVARIGDDACYRSVGEPVAEFSIDDDGVIHRQGNWEDAAFLVAWRSTMTNGWPPALPGLNQP
jgi:hypothetical protein